jgi:hypothetical protein
MDERRKFFLLYAVRFDFREFFLSKIAMLLYVVGPQRWAVLNQEAEIP